MLGSTRLILLIKLILLQLLELMCIEDNSIRRLRSSLMNFISVSNNDDFAVLNCSTPERVSHQKLDWYFQTYASSTSPRVIWQRGRSNTDRYIAYSPDQFRHFLQIKPLQLNDSGIYMCVDQTTGFSSRIELIIPEPPNSTTQLTNSSLILLTLLFLCFFRSFLHLE